MFSRQSGRGEYVLDDIFRWYLCLSEIKPVKGINSWGESNVSGWMQLLETITEICDEWN